MEKSVLDLFKTMKDTLDVKDYNYDRFTRKYLMEDVMATITGRGIKPLDDAPDFELFDTEGNGVRLSSFKGKPVYLHFGSFS